MFYLGKTYRYGNKEQKQTALPTQQQASPSVGQQQQQPTPSVGQQQQQPTPSMGQQQQQQQQPTPSMGQQQQPTPSVGQQQQPAPSVGQQQQQPAPAVGQQQQQPTPSIGQQQQQQPTPFIGQQQQPLSLGRYHLPVLGQQNPPVLGKQQQQPSPSIGQQQQQQPPSLGQQQQLNLSGQQQTQPQISPQTNLSLLTSQTSAKTLQQNIKPTPAYIPPKQIGIPTQVTPASILPHGVQPQYMTSQTQPTISLTMPAPSPLEIEVRYETHIRNEIDDFSEDLEALKTKIREKFGDFDDTFHNKMKDLVGSDEEKNKMYAETASVRRELNHTVKICDEMNQILSTIRNEGFHIQEKIEDANTAKKWISTAKFSSFIAATPLDPISEEKKKLLLQTFNIIDQRLQELEISMEEMSLRSSDNDTQAVMQTMKLLEQNLQKLHAKLDSISEQADTLKLNRQISRINLSNSCIHPFELLNKSLEKRHFNFKIQSDRIVELKDFLYQTPTPRIIKPRNPADTLNIPRTVKHSARQKPLPDLQQPKPFTTSPNQGFKLLLSPQGDFFVSPNPQSLPDGCVSFDIHKLSQSMAHTLPKQQQQQQQLNFNLLYQIFPSINPNNNNNNNNNSSLTSPSKFPTNVAQPAVILCSGKFGTTD